MAIEDLLSQADQAPAGNPWLARHEPATAPEAPAAETPVPTQRERDLAAELDALRARLDAAPQPQITPQDVAGAAAWGARTALADQQAGPQIQLPERPKIDIGDELLEPKNVAAMIQAQTDWAFQAAYQAAMQQAMHQFGPALQQFAGLVPHVQGSWEQAARAADSEARNAAVASGIPAEEFDEALPRAVALLQQNSGPNFATRRTDPATLRMLVNHMRLIEGKPVPVGASPGTVSIGVNGGSPGGGAPVNLSGERAQVARRVQEMLGVKFDANDLHTLGAA